MSNLTKNLIVEKCTIDSNLETVIIVYMEQIIGINTLKQYI